MDFLKAALELAARGFHVFPLIPRRKTPPDYMEGFPQKATRDEAQISSWWQAVPNANIGISTTRFGDNEALLVVDVDNKDGKNGDATLFALELEGREFPSTLEQKTPTGGRHLIYRVSQPVKQGVETLGKGLDTRSRGGFIVGAGSVVKAGQYTIGSGDIAVAPSWMVEHCGLPRERTPGQTQEIAGVDLDAAITRAIHYLTHEAPASIKGQGGDATAYKVAACVKDFGVPAEITLNLMLDHWNHRCPPGWEPQKLWAKVRHAYQYGHDPVGAISPEADFKDVVKDLPKDQALSPIAQLNEEFAFVIAGGSCHILWETKDPNGDQTLEHISVEAFHKRLAHKKVIIGERQRKLTEVWMQSSQRRSYDGICFRPGLPTPERFYNLWRGFKYKPFEKGEVITNEMRDSLSMFTDHAMENVCHGDKGLFRWLMGYFAHLIQKPWEKPLVAPVFRGLKGVGKNALIDRVGALLGSHYILAADKRYLTGNFNSHLENALLFVLDEAFWSGDKQSEGVLKSLITGTHHIIEHKGREPYKVDNRTRVAILGNAEWIVPASHDERRFAVFDVGAGRKQDRTFFQTMREGMERGGYRLLLEYFLNYDLAGIDVNDAPKTKGLLDQKLETLDPFYQWWFECLLDGGIQFSEFGASWPEELCRKDLRDAYGRYLKDRQIRGWVDTEERIGKLLKICLPALGSKNRRLDSGHRSRVYILPSLEEARKAWEKFIGHEMAWN